MTRTRIFVASLFVLVALAGSAVALGQPEQRSFSVRLTGDEENPPVDTRAHGHAGLQIHKLGTAISYRLNVAGITDVTAAHIHCGAEGVNGPVVAFLYGGPTITPRGTLASSDLIPADVIPVADSAACPGGVANIQDLVEKLQNGGAYVNVHTLQNPGGEIRGQVD